MSNIVRRRLRRVGEHKAEHAGSNFLAEVARQTVEDFKLSCMDPVILFVNIHTMLIYGVLYLWFEFFPFGTPIVIRREQVHS